MKFGGPGRRPGITSPGYKWAAVGVGIVVLFVFYQFLFSGGDFRFLDAIGGHRVDGPPASTPTTMRFINPDNVDSIYQFPIEDTTKVLDAMKRELGTKKGYLCFQIGTYGWAFRRPDDQGSGFCRRECALLLRGSFGDEVVLMSKGITDTRLGCVVVTGRGDSWVQSLLRRIREGK